MSDHDDTDLDQPEFDGTEIDQADDDFILLREDVDYLFTVLDSHPASPSNTATQVPTSATTSAAPKPGAAHVWHTLTSGEAGRAWEALIDWVDWLLDRYRLDETIPGCWYRHGAMVDELDALRAAWTAAYLNPAAKPLEPAVWLEQLNRALDRIRKWDRYGCAAGTHHDDTAPTPGAGHGTRERAKFLLNDRTARARAQRQPAHEPESGADCDRSHS